MTAQAPPPDGATGPLVVAVATQSVVALLVRMVPTLAPVLIVLYSKRIVLRRKIAFSILESRCESSRPSTSGPTAMWIEVSLGADSGDGRH